MLSDPLVGQVFGKDASGDPYEGLPQWMVDDVPHVTEVRVVQALNPHIKCKLVGDWNWMTDENGVNCIVFTETVQLERDGKPLTKADILPSLKAGDKGDFKWKTK